MKVIDTFPFNGDWIIRMRLEFLFPFVDEFVITESRYTFSGEKKDFLYKDKWCSILREYESKIHWVIVDEYLEPTETWHQTFQDQPWFRSENATCWFNEHHQRDVAFAYIQEKYKDFEYIVHVGDVDEIPETDIFHPSARKVMYNKLNDMGEPLFLEMLFFYYNFYWKKPYNWYRAYIINKEQLQKNSSLSYWRLIFRPNFVLRNAGWHFSYFMDIRDIQRKIKSFSHQEYNDPRWTDREHLKECIALGKDVFQRDIDNESLTANESIGFPEAIEAFRGELDYLQLS